MVCTLLFLLKFTKKINRFHQIIINVLHNKDIAKIKEIKAFLVDILTQYHSHSLFFFRNRCLAINFSNYCEFNLYLIHLTLSSNNSI